MGVKFHITLYCVRAPRRGVGRVCISLVGTGLRMFSFSWQVWICSFPQCYTVPQCLGKIIIKANIFMSAQTIQNFFKVQQKISKSIDKYAEIFNWTTGIFSTLQFREIIFLVLIKFLFILNCRHVSSFMLKVLHSTL